MDYHTQDERKESGLVPFAGRELDAEQVEKQKLILQTLNKAQVDFLLQRTPKHEIKYRQGRGGLQFAYVEHGYVTERLNLVFGFNWDFEVVDKQILEDEVIVEAKLTVRTPGGQTIVKTQFGGADIKRHASGAKSGRPLSIADDYKAAASDALKKCASLLGIGLDLYGRDHSLDNDPYEVTAISPQPKSEPVADSPTEDATVFAPQGPGLCSRSQQREIRALAGDAGLEVPALCASLGVTELSELTGAKAQRVIIRLRERASQARAAS